MTGVAGQTICYAGNARTTSDITWVTNSSIIEVSFSTQTFVIQ